MQRQTGTAWEELARTAAAVRATTPGDVTTVQHSWLHRQWRRIVLTSAGAVLSVLGVIWVLHAPEIARADGGADSTLFSLTNQDRASNGVRSVGNNGALQTVGENGSYSCGGLHINGRSYDMIQRNYFSHIIPGCNTYVWPMMSAYGVHYLSAGENIGWVNNDPGNTAAAGFVNTAFMNSPDHRANILNGSYTDLGVGSWYGSGDTFCGGSCGPVWMFSEEFAQLGSAPPPPPPPPPPRPPTNPAPRNSPAPTEPLPPADTPAPTAVPTPTPTPTPTPIPTALLPAGVPAPPTYSYPGLLPSTVESVLSSFLIS